jgi:pimeloyl-ACP methyl ester carboxylesterase
MAQRLFLFSGLGCDARMVSRLSVPGVEVVAADHLEPLPGEALSPYAGRVAEYFGIEVGDAVRGASFGGMLAAQIASQRAVAGLVLLGSCLRSARLPAFYPWAERVSRFLPDGALTLRSRRWVVRRLFDPVTPEVEDLLIDMAAQTPPGRFRAFARMIMTWPGVDRPACPILSIHGMRDRVIPVACAEPGVRLPDGGHAFMLTNADAVSAELSRSLRGCDKIPFR